MRDKIDKLTLRNAANKSIKKLIKNLDN